jgi:hypothetical protein
MRRGLLVILIGILFFFKNTGVLDPVSFNLLWPVIAMLVGVAMVTRQRCGCGGWGCKWCKWCKGVTYNDFDGIQRGRNVCDCNCEKCGNCDTKSK